MNATNQGAVAQAGGQLKGLALFNATMTSPRTQDYLHKVLGNKASSFVNNLTSLVANNKMLQECQPTTVMYAAMKATALDLPLDPNLGHAYVIPYRNKRAGVTEAQFQIGYLGFIQLAIRSGQLRTINVTEVREGELDHYDLLTGRMVFEGRPNRETLEVIGYVAYIEMTNGFAKSIYMTRGEIEAHARQYSQSFKQGDGVWRDNFDAMAKKTVLKALLKHYAPLSVELQDAVRSDQGVLNESGQPQYVDNVEEAVAEEIRTAHASIDLEDDATTAEATAPTAEATAPTAGAKTPPTAPSALGAQQGMPELDF